MKRSGRAGQRWPTRYRAVWLPRALIEQGRQQLAMVLLNTSWLHLRALRRLMSMINENDQVDRAISKAKLHALLHVHTPPINVVVFHGPDREYSFSGGFPA